MRPLTKTQREILRGMFGGKCSYCGCDLGEKWHADHVEPVMRESKFFREAGKPLRMRATGDALHPDRDCIENMLPACAPCNIRKGGEALESFRLSIERAIEVLRKNQSTYRHAVRFGLITERPGPVIFHFEKAQAGGGDDQSTDGQVPEKSA